MNVLWLTKSPITIYLDYCILFSFYFTAAINHTALNLTVHKYLYAVDN